MLVAKHCRPSALRSADSRAHSVSLIQHVFTECLLCAESKTDHIPPGIKAAYVMVREEAGKQFTIVCQMLLLPATEDKEQGGEGVIARHAGGVCVGIQ